MDLFPRTFLLVFAQLSVGGFLALSIPPFHEMQRGYYKSSGVVYLLFGALALVGRLALLGKGADVGPLQLAELLTWVAFVACAAAYCTSLWGERVVLRARLFSATWLTGLTALTLAAFSYGSGAMPVYERIFYPVTFLLSALVLGAASTGMLLGHWYLIDRDLSLEPLRTVLRVYRWGLLTQCLVLGLAALLFANASTTATGGGFRPLVDFHLGALAARLLTSPVGAGILAVMIRRTLDIPQTMAATGLFYIAVLAVMVGEFLGRYLLFRTGLPL